MDWNWRGEGVARIGARHYGEESAQVGDGAGQGSDNADPGERAAAGRIVASGGNAAGRGLKSADAAKVSGGADGTAAVAADSAHRATGGDRGGFATAGASCRIRRIPWVGSFAAHAVVCFVGHQEFGRIGAAEQDCAGIFETRDRVALVTGM